MPGLQSSGDTSLHRQREVRPCVLRVPVLPLSIDIEEGLILTSPTGVVTYITQVSDLITPLIFCETVRCVTPDATPVIVNTVPSSDCFTSIRSYVGITPASLA